MDLSTNQVNSIYTVKALVGELRQLMESNYRHIVVEGEISSLARPASGHLYFSLKEGNALIRCAFFRNRRIGSSDPEEGMQVQVRGQISIYESRGDLQLIVTRLQPAGLGALQQAFDRLKKKLLEEGLFDAQHKQPLPAIPGSIGIVTSLTGAALHDIRVTLNRRFAAANVVVYPSMVQGEQAAKLVCKAIQTANARQEVDVLIVARGGGSLEDLQAFNDESVARAIFNSGIPVVCGVGHETDFTIADMVADERAATPTAAAELVTPDGAKMLFENAQLRKRLIDLTSRFLDQHRQSIDYASARLVHPAQRLRRYRLEHRNISNALVSSARLSFLKVSGHIERNRIGVIANNPLQLVRRCRQQLASHKAAMSRQVQFDMKSRSLELTHRRNQLSMVSPMQTLERGYAILQTADGEVISAAGQLEKQQLVEARLRDGTAQLEVKSIQKSRK